MFIRGPEKPLAPFCRSIRAECGGRSAQAGGEGAASGVGMLVGIVLRMSLAHSQHGLNQLALGRLQLARE